MQSLSWLKIFPAYQLLANQGEPVVDKAVRQVERQGPLDATVEAKQLQDGLAFVCASICKGFHLCSMQAKTMLSNGSQCIHLRRHAFTSSILAKPTETVLLHMQEQLSHSFDTPVAALRFPSSL